MNDFRLRTLKPRYEQLFASCQIRSSWLDRIASAAATIQSLRSRYYDAIAAQTSVPWWFTGILHYRDLGFQEAHLHNGDPLTGRTLRNPPGRPNFLPANGRTYTFVESAVDALRWQTFDTAQDRSISAWLWRFELWNGFDYAIRGMNSEYLWNGTSHFGSGNNRGRFLPDKRFDPNAQSEQAGAAAILWYFYYKGMIDSGLQDNVGTPQIHAPAFAGNLTRIMTVPTVGLVRFTGY
jgi:lysozyme family protein